MFDDHNPLKHFDFETEGAVATWPVGADEFNRDYTMDSLGDEVIQLYCDGGWVTSNEGYESGGGMFGIGGHEVEQEGNRTLFFEDEVEELEPEYMIFTGPEMYNSDLAEISGEEINRNGLEDGDVVVVREDAEGYHLERAENPEAMEDCIAFGYAEAFDDGFPVVTVENARDAYMALGYDEDFQQELESRHQEVRKKVEKDVDNLQDEHMVDDWWERSDHKEEGDGKTRYGLHKAIAERYHKENGEYMDSWNSSRDFNSIRREELEQLSNRDDELGEMAENLITLRDRKSTLRHFQTERYRKDLLGDLFEDTWYENVVSQSADLRDEANSADEEFIAVHDVHDAFNTNMDSAKFDNPNLSDSEKASRLVSAAEKEFEHVEIYGIPWDNNEDGKEQSIEMRDDLMDVFPTYEDIISEDDLPFARGTGITHGTPFRPVMALSNEPLDVQEDEIVDLSDIF